MKVLNLQDEQSASVEVKAIENNSSNYEIATIVDKGSTMEIRSRASALPNISLSGGLPGILIHQKLEN